VAVGGSLLLAFCPLIWMYSIQAEVIYTPPVLVTLRRLLLWCVCLLAHKTCVGQEAGTPAASWCARDTLRRQAHQLPLGVQETHSGGRHTSCLLVCKRHTQEAGTPAASWCARDTLRRQAHQLPLGVPGGRHSSCLLVCQETHCRHTSCLLVCKRHTASWHTRLVSASRPVAAGVPASCRPVLVCLHHLLMPWALSSRRGEAWLWSGWGGAQQATGDAGQSGDMQACLEGHAGRPASDVMFHACVNVCLDACVERHVGHQEHVCRCCE
jgi:hypothetical protein